MQGSEEVRSIFILILFFYLARIVCVVSWKSMHRKVNNVCLHSFSRLLL